MKNNTYKWEQVREALTDRNVLLLMVYQLTFSIPNGAYTTVRYCNSLLMMVLTSTQFSSLVMAGFGFSKFQVYLFNIPMGAFLACFALGSSFLCSRFNGYRTVVGSALSIIRCVK